MAQRCSKVAPMSDSSLVPQKPGLTSHPIESDSGSCCPQVPTLPRALISSPGRVKRNADFVLQSRKGRQG